MKAPFFWARRGKAARLLSPLQGITRALTARRVKKPGFSPGIPVICVGNAGVGGAGKTILALDLLARLPGRPFALTRGYKGRQAGPMLVTTDNDAQDVGDEALLLSSNAPTVLSRNRAAGARLALAEGATAIVMDDGLQNPGLNKNAAFLVIDGGFGFGNGMLLPAGPLREPVSAAAARCRAAVLIGEDRCNALAALPAGLPVLRAELAPSCRESLLGRPVVAFAGIGRPEKFFDSARALGASLVAAIPFPDHHVYTDAELQRLKALAAGHRALLLTTAKDFVKLPRDLQTKVKVLRVGLSWHNEAALVNLLREIV